MLSCCYSAEWIPKIGYSTRSVRSKGRASAGVCLERYKWASAGMVAGRASASFAPLFRRPWSEGRVAICGRGPRAWNPITRPLSRARCLCQVLVIHFVVTNIAESIGKALAAVQASIDAPISPDVFYRVPPRVHESGKGRVTEPKLSVGRKRETLPGKMFAAITLFPAAFHACIECPTLLFLVEH